MSATTLDLASRAAAVAAMAASGTGAIPALDVLVVGGGVVGAGAALDAASRGLRVALVERDDYASGTSSRSSRLAHGGLRYLEQGEFGLVHEALTERGRLLEHLAPHLVRPVPFLLPLTKGWERPYLGAGVALYDALSKASRAGGALPGHRHLTRRAALKVAPGLRGDVISGAIGFFDAQIDDARHTLALVRSAAGAGALVANRVEVVGFLRDGERVVGATLRDRETGAQHEVRARVVLGATGVWTPQTQALLDGTEPPATVAPSKGVHLVVPRAAIDARTALIARTSASVLFLLPWGRQWIVGTTDTPDTAAADERDETGSPLPTETEVDYLLEQANRWLVRPLTRGEVLGSYAGLRPLLAADADPAGADTTTLSREHAVLRPAPGFVAVTGGKYTTYRVMAADAVDAAVADLGVAVGGSRTADLPLFGADGFAQLWAEREFLVAETGLEPAQVQRLLRRYGSAVDEVFDLMGDDPALRAPVHPDAPVLAAEVVYAAASEGALSVADVMARRTRLALQLPDAARASADTVAALLGGVLGWDRETVADQAQQYRTSRAGVILPAPQQRATG